MRRTRQMLKPTFFLLDLFAATALSAQPRRKVIINEDCSGPGGSNMQTLAVLIQSPQVEVLGITIVSGDQWRDEEVAHTLRLLEIMGRTDIPVLPGPAFPLVRTRAESQLWQHKHGRVGHAGAADEDAAHFLLRIVGKYPHEVTIYEGGPMTNLALAISLDRTFQELAKELV